MEAAWAVGAGQHITVHGLADEAVLLSEGLIDADTFLFRLSHPGPSRFGLQHRGVPPAGSPFYDLQSLFALSYLRHTAVRYHWRTSGMNPQCSR